MAATSLGSRWRSRCPCRVGASQDREEVTGDGRAGDPCTRGGRAAGPDAHVVKIVSRFEKESPREGTGLGTSRKQLNFHNPQPLTRLLSRGSVHHACARGLRPRWGRQGRSRARELEETRQARGCGRGTRPPRDPATE